MGFILQNCVRDFGNWKVRIVGDVLVFVQFFCCMRGVSYGLVRLFVGFVVWDEVMSSGWKVRRIFMEVREDWSRVVRKKIVIIILLEFWV